MPFNPDTFHLQTTAGPELPLNPSGLVATAGDQIVTITWDDDADVDTWEVWYSSTNDFADGGLLVDGLTDPEHVHSGSDVPGNKWFYWVRAIGANGPTSWVGPVSARAYVVVPPSGTVNNLYLPTDQAWMWGTVLFMSAGEPPNGTQMGDNDGAPSVTYDASGNSWDSGAGDISSMAIYPRISVYDASGNGFTFWDTEPPSP